jgi:hypothetical protein
VAIVENVDDATLNSESCAAAASESESTILLQHTAPGDNNQDEGDTDDEADELIVVSGGAAAPLTTVPLDSGIGATVVQNGAAHALADEPLGGKDDDAGASLVTVPPPEMSPVQVVSAVSGKKMSLAEARAEFFKI